jgi:hypothetical protein
MLENLLDEACLEGIDKNDQQNFKPQFELLSVGDESPTRKIFEIETSVVDEGTEYLFI